MKKKPTQYLDKSLVAHSFKESCGTYEESAVVQKEISGHLVRLLQERNAENFSRVLEIGCCTGVLTELLSKNYQINTLFVNDIVPDFCSSTLKRVGAEVQRGEMVPGDIEGLNLPHDLDLVVSSSTFQWMVDLPSLFHKIQLSLREKGILAFSIFGPGTMEEISSITGHGLQYHPAEEILMMLEPEFNIISSDAQKKILYFPTVRAVLRHIRQTGVGGLGRIKWSHSKLRDFENQYRTRFANEEGLPVTYCSTFVVAEKKGYRT